MAPPVVLLIDAALKEDSSLGKCDERTPPLLDKADGNGGSILPHNVPPNTLCDAKVSFSHFMSAMDLRTTTSSSKNDDDESSNEDPQR